MARRKKSHRTSRRRRVSGIKSGAAMEVIAIAAGAVAAKFLVKTLAGKLNDKMLNGAILAGGIFIPKFIKGDFGKGIGAGMIASGSVGMLNSFGVLQGIGADDAFTMEFISGDDSLSPIGEMEDEEAYAPSLNGLGNLSPISGIDNIEGIDSDENLSDESMKWVQGFNND